MSSTIDGLAAGRLDEESPLMPCLLRFVIVERSLFEVT